MVDLADFRVELVRTADDVAVVEAAGELDLHTCREFRECLVGAVEENAARVVVDLAGVTFIDSTSLGVLVGGARRSAQRGTELMIVCPAGSVSRILEITGLSRALTIYATREEALGAGTDGKAQ
jgi:anti-sigma B factor antagonist